MSPADARCTPEHRDTPKYDIKLHACTSPLEREPFRHHGGAALVMCSRLGDGCVGLWLSIYIELTEQAMETPLAVSCGCG